MTKQENKSIPCHVAIILDGNRRWARERNLPTLEGHRKGYEKMRQAPEWFFSRGVEILSVFAFSTENWNRTKQEVDYLMSLLAEAIEKEIQTVQEKGYRIVVSGRIKDLPGKLPEKIYEVMDQTKNNQYGMFNICLNYGGRAEIVDAVKKMIKNKVEVEQVHEGLVSKYLYNSDVITDPDIIVRTSGEMRLSGFMLWRSAYSEFLFMRKYWPEFEEQDVDFILSEYANRQRRFGGDG